jgi:hypothetical protein
VTGIACEFGFNKISAMADSVGAFANALSTTAFENLAETIDRSVDGLIGSFNPYPVADMADPVKTIADATGFKSPVDQLANGFSQVAGTLRQAAGDAIAPALSSYRIRCMH